ncbi:unnamed protein product [Owenia fusiformis]|uniref:Chloride channel protein n=1 Tax=Owenia fusiformis TaxID=6347 RepID=A0A8S4NU93_OWEFU|nr:unnamed protein product [Owenia fusiformis]
MATDSDNVFKGPVPGIKSKFSTEESLDANKNPFQTTLSPARSYPGPQGHEDGEKHKSHPLRRLSSKFESFDFEVAENTHFLKHNEGVAEKEQAKHLKRESMARYLVSILTGIGTAIIALAIKFSIHYLADIKFGLIGDLMTKCSHTGCTYLPLLAFVGVNLILTFIGSWMVTYIEPAAMGSGIPQIKCYLNGVRIPGLVSLKALIVKATGVILSVLGGLACGKEGPMIHSGAAVAAGISQGRSLVLKRDFKIFRYFRSDTEKRDFVAAGAAAGVSAAFGAPIGGVLFSLEEGASFLYQTLTWRMVAASVTATLTINIVVSLVHGHPENLSEPGLISFGQFSDIYYLSVELPLFLMQGLIGGIFGAVYVHLNYKLTVFRRAYITEKWMKLLEACIVAVISALMHFMFVWASNDCTDITPHGAHVMTVQGFCPDGKHSSMATIFMKAPEGSLIGMLHNDIKYYEPLGLLIAMVFYFLLATWTYGISVSSGLFIPSLLIGAMWGRLYGIGVSYFVPSAAAHIGKYALIGAACNLSGAVRMTISLTVIVIECTGDITFGMPMLLCMMLSKYSADFFNKGIYDTHIELMGVPLLEWEPPELCATVKAREVMNAPVVVLKPLETVGRILDVLKEEPHMGFPVVASYDPENARQGNTFGRLQGLMTRSQLILLLHERVYKDNKRDLDISFEDIEAKLRNVKGIDIPDNDRELMIDLRSYMNPTPFSVSTNVSLPRMFKLFRGLGLRHLIVVNDKNEVEGIVTRKDLAKYRAHGELGKIKLHHLEVVQ